MKTSHLAQWHEDTLAMETIKQNALFCFSIDAALLASVIFDVSVGIICFFIIIPPAPSRSEHYYQSQH